MLVKVLKEDVTVSFRNYGNITVPRGTMTNHRTALGDDPACNFVCEFDWIDTHYPQIANILKSDAGSYGINIPEDKLIRALRVKFLYDDYGNCRDIFRDYYAPERYCRMDTGDGLVQWCSLTGSNEAYCPVRTDILIQVVSPDGKVVTIKQQYIESAEHKTPKTFAFSWEKITGGLQDKVTGQIYRKDVLRYIIDKKEGYKGFIENVIGEDGIVHYTDFLNFEEYKKEKANENLVVIDQKQLEEETGKYKRSRMKVFEEITEEEFYRLYECLPPVRPKKRCGAFSFFMQEAWVLSLHTFCFKYNGNYYKGIRDILQKEEDLERDIDTFLKYFTLEYDDLLKLASGYHYIHRTNGGASEFDTSINDISRAMVHQFRKKHGQCFLGKINLYDQERKNPDVKLVPYDGQLIYNFEYGFVLPCHDEELIAMIKEHNTEKEVPDPSAIMDRINKIFERIYALGGTALSWA